MSPRCAAAACLLIPSLLLASCATTQPAAQVEQSGSHRVACDRPLASCLAAFDKCREGFDVVQGTEERRHHGPELPAETVRSEAVLRCRQNTVLFGKAEGASVAGPAAPEKPVAAATACFPGATHGCLGPGACQGAQVCLASGAAFGPCDCGTAGAGTPAPPTAPTPVAPINPAPPDASVR